MATRVEELIVKIEEFQKQLREFQDALGRVGRQTLFNYYFLLLLSLRIGVSAEELKKIEAKCELVASRLGDAYIRGLETPDFKAIFDNN